jgi:hypothetical protein
MLMCQEKGDGKVVLIAELRRVSRQPGEHGHGRVWAWVGWLRQFVIHHQSRIEVCAVGCECHLTRVDLSFQRDLPAAPALSGRCSSCAFQICFVVHASSSTRDMPSWFALVRKQFAVPVLTSLDNRHLRYRNSRCRGPFAWAHLDHAERAQFFLLALPPTKSGVAPVARLENVTLTGLPGTNADAAR